MAVSLSLLDDDDDDEHVDESVVVAVDVLEVSSSSFFMTRVDRHSLVSIKLVSLDNNILIMSSKCENGYYETLYDKLQAPGQSRME